MMQTNRPTNENMENLLGKVHPVLDHGGISVVDYMGTEQCIVDAARISYSGGGTIKKNTDTGLIYHLLRNWHTSCFEMAEIKFHVKLPIFVMRQWIRHRTANVNEMSARYSILDKEFYIPALDRIMGQGKTNKQGSEGELPAEDKILWIQELTEDLDRNYDTYESAVKHRGIARETARNNLPVSVYTQMVWKIDLHNLLHFLRLRCDPHAQWEIRVYADVMCDMVKQWMPTVYDAAEQYRFNSQNISSKGMDLIKKMIKGEPVCFEESGMQSKNEFKQFMDLWK